MEEDGDGVVAGWGSGLQAVGRGDRRDGMEVQEPMVRGGPEV